MRKRPAEFFSRFATFSSEALLVSLDQSSTTARAGVGVVLAKSRV